MLLDVFSKGVRGKEAEKALDQARITVNKNAIPFDSNPPLNPSGIRLGSPAVTTRGFREPEMRETGELIAEVLNHIASEEAIAGVRQRVEALTARFPLYRWKLASANSRASRRCTSLSTRGVSAISASAPTSEAWSTRWGRIDAVNRYTLDRRAGRRAHARPGCPRIFNRCNIPARDTSALDHVAFPMLLHRLAPTWCTFPSIACRCS